MTMNRYVLYNVIMVGLMNLMLFVPNILYQYEFNGTVPSLIIAAFIGPAFGYAFIHTMKKFPSQGVPEILLQRYPRWLVVPMLLFFAFMWFTAASIALMVFASIINRFFNPDANVMIILIMMCLICIYAASRSTLSVLFNMEMMMLLNVPLILLLLLKTVRSEQMNWDAIRTATNYLYTMPQWAAVAAATFIFTGYLNIAIYNRALSPNFIFKGGILFPIAGILILGITYFVPIGLHGVDGIGTYLYVWTATSDALVMEYGFIERVLFVFLILYLDLTLIYTSSGWHQAMEMVKSCFPKYKPIIDEHPLPRSNYVICSIFAAATLIAFYFSSEKYYITVTNIWLIVRMVAEYGLVVWIVLLGFGRRKQA